MSIEIKNVSKNFGDFKALENINLNVSSGELVALLGPSGSGKTTLLRIVGGVDVPDEGEILIDGINCANVNAANRKVGFVFQHYALFKHMTVFDNVAFGLQVRPKKSRPSKEEIKNKVFELLHLIQLERMADRYPHQLSGGQKQRVALARALAVEPKVLLLDEPFGALDAKVRRDLRYWLRKLHDTIHVTSVFVTHDQEEALEVANRVVIMNEGKIQQVGTSEEVYHHPANPFVYNFLGNVNLFHCRVEDGKAYYGDTPMELKSGVDQNIKNLTMYVRPHMLSIHRQPVGKQSIKAGIRHINAAGPVVKVELANEHNEVITVEITHQEFKSLNLRKTETVFIAPKDKQVFSADYSI